MVHNSLEEICKEKKRKARRAKCEDYNRMKSEQNDTALAAPVFILHEDDEGGKGKEGDCTLRGEHCQVGGDALN